MGVSLNHPIEGAVNWAGSIGANWTALQNQYVARDASPTSQVTVTGTTSETLLMTGSVPANSLAAGSVMPIYAGGFFSVPANTTPTITWRIRWGGISGIVLMTVNFNVASSGSVQNFDWWADVRYFCASAGSSGTVDGEGYMMLNTNLITLLASGLSTIDTTTTKTLAWTIQTTDVNDSITQDLLVVNLG